MRLSTIGIWKWVILGTYLHQMSCRHASIAARECTWCFKSNLHCVYPCVWGSLQFAEVIRSHPQFSLDVWTSPHQRLRHLSCYLSDLRQASGPLAQTLPGHLSPALVCRRRWAESSPLHCIQGVNLHSHSPALFTWCLSAPVCPVPRLLLQQEGTNKTTLHSIWNMRNDHQSANAAPLFTSNYCCCDVSQNLQLQKNSGSSRGFLDIFLSGRSLLGILYFKRYMQYKYQQYKFMSGSFTEDMQNICRWTNLAVLKDLWLSLSHHFRDANHLEYGDTCMM